MATKIYKVIINILCQDDFENTIRVKVFADKQLALQYYNELIESEKEYETELNLDDYTIDKSENYYERYLTGYASEDCLTIQLQEDEICESLEKSNDTEKEYEM